MPHINEETKAHLWAYLAKVANELDHDAVEVGGVADHVHLLCHGSRTMTVSDFLKDLKISSSKWMKSQGGVSQFAWQRGYGAFSVSASNAAAVREYILGQEKHHQLQSFKDEYREFLRKHGVGWDEKYVWG